MYPGIDNFRNFSTEIKPHDGYAYYSFAYYPGKWC